MSSTIRTLKILVAGVALATAFAAPLSQAGVAVIVNPDAAIAKADKTSVQKLFLGKSKSISGKNLEPVDQADSEVKKKFYTVVVGKSSSQLRAYWSRLIFTGKGTQPKEIGSDADVVKAVAADPSLIGYVDSSAVDSSVTVILISRIVLARRLGRCGVLAISFLDSADLAFNKAHRITIRIKHRCRIGF